MINLWYIILMLLYIITEKKIFIDAKCENKLQFYVPKNYFLISKSIIYMMRRDENKQIYLEAKMYAMKAIARNTTFTFIF